jgi:uncharacterized NAD(P)/FAD-binding protein YdhS
MRKIGIIGGGFSGTMTAVHLIQNAVDPIEIIIICEGETFNKGIAFNPYSKYHLLNVPASKMSAFENNQKHFVDWIMQQDSYANKDKDIIANSFLPRQLYGQYLADIWRETIKSEQANKVKIQVVNAFATDLDIAGDTVSIWLSNNEKITVNICVIASGNHIPRNPGIKNTSFFKSENYFQNPWNIKSVSVTDSRLPILIIGNGLTMVDTVLGLLENNFQNEIYSLSPDGFNILPHRHSSLEYTKLVDELPDNASLFEIVKLFNKHIKLIREFGLSAEPIIDSLRPHTQEIWQRLTINEKKLFMARLRHLWGVARHRVPLHIHDKIQQLRIDNKLHIYAGKLLDIVEEERGINVEFYNKKQKRNVAITVSRVINCTGPETDLMRLKKDFLKNCLVKGIIHQDELKLGINTDTTTYQTIDSKGNRHKNLFTIGINLRGMLWETTAINEIRVQACRLAKTILAMSDRQESQDQYGFNQSEPREMNASRI